MLAADARNFEAAWKLARADYWLGGHAPEAERRGFFERGIDAGRKAAALQPTRPVGHFGIAANMGALSVHNRCGGRNCQTVEAALDEYVDPEDGSEFPNCSFPDCGCDGARVCPAKSGAKHAADAWNLERRKTPNV